MAVITLGSEEKKQLTKAVDNAVEAMRDIDDIRQGMNEIVKEVAKEIDIPAKTIKKAIKYASSNDRASKDQQQIDDALELLQQLNR